MTIFHTNFPLDKFHYLIIFNKNQNPNFSLQLSIQIYNQLIITNTFIIHQIFLQNLEEY